MTLGELISKAASIASKTSTDDAYSLELYDEQFVLITDVRFELFDDEDGTFIQMTVI